jgi:[acyl-carrier-protein] S-malonyltransferase
MGRDIADEYEEARHIFDLADRTLGIELSALCFEGPEEELVKTENTQPALFTTSVAIMAVLQSKGLRPSAAAGHSVGEYAALVAAGSIEFEEAITVVRRRGELMAAAVEETPGAMAAILGLDENAVTEICQEARDHGVVEPSNINSPSQIVVSGEVAAVLSAMEVAQGRGGKAIRLNVSAPFHCSLMAPVRDALEPAINSLKVQDPLIPIIANVSGRCVESAGEVRRALLDQLAAPVRWADTMTWFLQADYDTFFELGPGKVLQGLFRAVSRDVSVRAVASAADIDGSIEKAS